MSSSRYSRIDGVAASVLPGADPAPPVPPVAPGVGQLTAPSLEIAQSGGSGAGHAWFDVCGSGPPGGDGAGATGRQGGGTHTFTIVGVACGAPSGCAGSQITLFWQSGVAPLVPSGTVHGTGC